MMFWLDDSQSPEFRFFAEFTEFFLCSPFITLEYSKFTDVGKVHSIF